MQAKNKIQRKIIAYTPVFLCFRDDLNLVNLLKFNGEFLANYIHAQEIQNYANGLVELIGSFIDQTDWYEGWFKIAENVKNLPSNPEPEHTQIMNEPERLFEILSALNDKFVGDGAKLLLK